MGRSQWNAELRSLTQSLQQTIGDVYSATCRAELFSVTGQWRCNLIEASWKVSGSITSVTGRQSFADSTRAEANDYFNHGKITWTSGDNDGLSMEVKTFSSGAFELYLPMPYDVEVGDTYDALPGCNKIGRNGDCKNKFNNYINFRGEEDLPGADEILAVGGA
jgi:uncharacterized phage protein (TIGR02218 family)